MINDGNSYCILYIIPEFQCSFVTNLFVCFRVCVCVLFYLIFFFLFLFTSFRLRLIVVKMFSCASFVRICLIHTSFRQGTDEKWIKWIAFHWLNWLCKWLIEKCLPSKLRLWRTIYVCFPVSIWVYVFDSLCSTSNSFIYFFSSCFSSNCAKMLKLLVGWIARLF